MVEIEPDEQFVGLRGYHLDRPVFTPRCQNLIGTAPHMAGLHVDPALNRQFSRRAFARDDRERDAIDVGQLFECRVDLPVVGIARRHQRVCRAVGTRQ